jgi:hypothetical protein
MNQFVFMKNGLVLLFLLFKIHCLHSQETGSFWYLRLVCEEDTTPVSSALVTAWSDTIKISSWQVNDNGYITIPKSIVKEHPAVLIRLNSSKFEAIELNADTLFHKDTILVCVNCFPVQLDEVRVISYKIPMIDPDVQKANKRHKKQKPEEEEVVERQPVCSKEQIAMYEAIKAGTWKMPDSLKKPALPSKNPHNYFSANIQYPEMAREFGIEERIWFSFVIDSMGQVQKIKLLRGKNPLLVIEAARVIAAMPRWKVAESYSDLACGQTNSYQSKLLKPMRFSVCINFHLK